MLTAQVLLPGLASSVPTARHFVESILTGWGSGHVAWTGALVVSELAANCALHARTEFSVRVDQSADGRIRIEVADGSVRIPLQRSYGTGATTGRGMRLVAELAADWGVDTRADGKTVWVELPSAGNTTAPADEDQSEVLLAAFQDDEDPSGPRVHVRGGPVAA